MNGEPQTVDALLEQAVAHRASDLHLTVGAPPAVRVRGELRPLDGCPPLDRDGIRSLLYRILTTEQMTHFDELQEERRTAMREQLRARR